MDRALTGPLEAKRGVARGASRARRRFVACVAIGVVTAGLTAVLLNVVVAACFPRMSRLEPHFSAAYLRRELSELRTVPNQTLFLGDSFVWGFRLPPDATAVHQLTAAGCACRNLAYPTGGPANFYALARTFQGYGIRPRAVVIEVNRMFFSPASAAFHKLNGSVVQGSVAQVAAPFLTPRERAALGFGAASGLRAKADAALSSLSLLYAMRLDIRGAFFDDDDPPPPPLGADLLRRYFDIPRLDEANVSVEYLEATLAVLRSAGTPVIAFMVPVNHAVIDPHVDRARYLENSRYIERVLRRGGASVLDLDAAFPSGDFADQVHLNARGQMRLATFLGAGLRTAGRDARRSSHA